MRLDFKFDNSDNGIISNWTLAPVTGKSYRFYGATASNSQAQESPVPYISFSPILRDDGTSAAIPVRPQSTGNHVTGTGFRSIWWTPNRRHPSFYELVSVPGTTVTINASFGGPVQGSGNVEATIYYDVV